MKVIYTAIMAQLKAEMPELKWIDLDEGQLDAGGLRPPVAFPAVLTDIALPSCQTLYGPVQQCRATVTVRIAQNPPVSRTNAGVPEDVRETALERYGLVERVYKTLSGFGTGQFNELSRTKQSREQRRDGIFVYRMEFETDFRDEPAAE